jgi:hypothetical protein
MAGADESGIQIRLPEILVQPAHLIVKMLRRRQRTNPEIDVADAARFEKTMVVNRRPRCCNKAWICCGRRYKSMNIVYNFTCVSAR